jgi:hypothetical protein
MDVLCVYAFILCLCCPVEALWRADHPSKECYCLKNDHETEKSALCSKVGARCRKNAPSESMLALGHRNFILSGLIFFPYRVSQMCGIWDRGLAFAPGPIATSKISHRTDIRL